MNSNRIRRGGGETDRQTVGEIDRQTNGQTAVEITKVVWRDRQTVEETLKRLKER